MVCFFFFFVLMRINQFIIIILGLPCCFMVDDFGDIVDIFFFGLQQQFFMLDLCSFLFT